MNNLLLENILDCLAEQPRGEGVNDDPGFWTDGKRILCPSEVECEVVAEFLRDVFREIFWDTEVKTGRFSPEVRDGRDGKDNRAGFYFIEFE